MSRLELSQPEWCTNNTYEHEDIIVRRVLHTTETSNSKCIPGEIPASTRYPSPESKFRAKCRILYPPTIYAIRVILYLPEDITKDLMVALGEHKLTNKRDNHGRIMIEVSIKRENLIWETGLEYQHQTHPEYLRDCMILVKDIFELTCKFKQCNETSQYTCYNDKHSKSWELAIACNRPTIVGFKQGNHWI